MAQIPSLFSDTWRERQTPSLFRICSESEAESLESRLARSPSPGGPDVKSEVGKHGGVWLSDLLRSMAETE